MKGRFKSSSLVIQGGKFIYKKCSPFLQNIHRIYSYSHTFKRIRNFKEKTKLYSRNSFPGRLTEINKTAFIDSNSSRTIKRLARIHQRLKSLKNSSLKHSWILSFIKRKKKRPYLSPVRILCIILITAIIANAVLSFVFDRSIGPLGWIIRGLFLFAAIFTLFSKASMSLTHKNSWILKKLRLD